jgi:hypothetical protein
MAEMASASVFWASLDIRGAEALEGSRRAPPELDRMPNRA